MHYSPDNRPSGDVISIRLPGEQTTHWTLQKAEALRLLIAAGKRGVTSLDAMQCAGIHRLASRVSDLNKPYPIVLSKLEGVGSGTRIARYTIDPALEIVEGVL